MWRHHRPLSQPRMSLQGQELRPVLASAAETLTYVAMPVAVSCVLMLVLSRPNSWKLPAISSPTGKGCGAAEGSQAGQAQCIVVKGGLPAEPANCKWTSSQPQLRTAMEARPSPPHLGSQGVDNGGGQRRHAIRVADVVDHQLEARQVALRCAHAWGAGQTPYHGWHMLRQFIVHTAFSPTPQRMPLPDRACLQCLPCPRKHATFCMLSVP